MKKSTKILIALVLLNLFLGGLLLSRESSSPIYNLRNLILDGLLLTWESSSPINDLINPKTRLETYMDLRKQSQSEMPLTDELYTVIFRRIPEKDNPLHPFYLFLWEYRRLYTAQSMSIPGEKFREPGHIIITPPLEHPTANPAPAEYFMSFISHNGRPLDEEKPRPFSGYNLVNKGDVIFDINQNGRVDWVSTRNYSQSSSGTSLKVVQIARMSRKAEVHFRVAVFSKGSLITTHPKGDLANEADWSFQCADDNRDGLLDLQIGPGAPGSIVPKVTFYWNPDKEIYESPSGMMSPYFRVLPTAQNWSPWRAGELLHPFDK